MLGMLQGEIAIRRKGESAEHHPQTRPHALKTPLQPRSDDVALSVGSSRSPVAFAVRSDRLAGCPTTESTAE